MDLAAPSPRTPGSVMTQTMWSPTGSSGVNFTNNTFMRGGRAMRPVSAVHSFADRSPLTLQDHVSELEPAASNSNFVKPVSPYLQSAMTSVKRATTAGARRSGGYGATASAGNGVPPPVTSSAAAAWGLGAATAHASANLRSPSARVDPLRDTTLTIEDLGRDGASLGKTCAPGSPNSKLVGGRWRWGSTRGGGEGETGDK